jgi:hypothetical protein
MLSASTIMFFFLTVVGLYVFWRLLKAMTLIFSIALVCGGIIFLWAHTEDSPPPGPIADTVPTARSTEDVIMEQGTRLLAKPVNAAAQKLVEVTQDEEALVQQVRDSGVGFKNIVEMARAFAQGGPVPEKSLAETTATP